MKTRVELPVRAAGPLSSRATASPSAPRPKAAPGGAAQAGQALTRLSTPDEVVDFGDTIVSGSGTRYAGGATEASGRVTHAVRETPAHPGGIEDAGESDLSIPPRLAGGAEWDCPFPREADHAGIDHAFVTLEVDVSAEGHVLSATAKTDAGHGFDWEARRCAMSKRWTPGRDRRGRAVASTTLVKVKFSR
jgi:protein TonB